MKEMLSDHYVSLYSISGTLGDTGTWEAYDRTDSYVLTFGSLLAKLAQSVNSHTDRQTDTHTHTLSLCLKKDQISESLSYLV